MRVFFTADNHFGHARIIDYTGRPFSSIEEMDQTMIDHWNFLVRPEDTVIHLGDFAFGNVETVQRYLSQVSGRIILILGNHDRRVNAFHRQRIEVWKRAVLSLPGGKRVFLQHRPVTDKEQWRGSSFQLCGHIHQKQHFDPKIINVGVDVWNFAPVPSEIVLGVALDRVVVLE